MKRALLLGGALFLLAAPLSAQHGGAPPGYYPPGYNGDIWTGRVTAVNDQTREITLTYTHGKKMQTFVGVLKDGLRAKRNNGSTYELKPSDFPIGGDLTVYYMERTEKVKGRKVKTNEIFRFAAAHN